MLIRPWQTGDEHLAVKMERHLSARSIDRRFLVGSGGRLPRFYLRHIAAGARPEWDAQVALDDGELCGWAEYGRRPACSPAADLAVLVADPWHRTGLATALVRALVHRMIAAGVRTIEADVTSGNAASHGLIRALAGAQQSPSYADGLLHYSFDLSLVPPEPPIPTAAARRRRAEAQ
ncbi:GNAT family N-acetyltransferase [Dactylosporangium vinaceum]|uniref:GNAT family N-acetyltransferase n=1 Tax=Dactylosporangium vinaceum TaxID=53362 RepID=A0ABV5M268_9ACTN|nr:GNAT family N-acetyltransferase [Dactylosporangium vinaceum]UAB99432.1 GNAT family N-acetyltransferase [Dactylosporangium vinaceum]